MDQASIEVTTLSQMKFLSQHSSAMKQQAEPEQEKLLPQKRQQQKLKPSPPPQQSHNHTKSQSIGRTQQVTSRRKRMLKKFFSRPKLPRQLAPDQVSSEPPEPLCFGTICSNKRDSF